MRFTVVISTSIYFMDQQFSKEIGEAEAEQQEEIEEEHEPELVASQFYCLYQDFLDKDQVSDSVFSKQYLAVLQQRGIYSENNQFVENISFKILSQSINCEIMVVEAHWGKVVQEITLVNCLHTSKVHPDHQIDNSSKGKYSSVFTGTLLNKQYAIKCTSIVPDFSKICILRALKEVFLLKLGSLLKFGPSVPEDNHFDLVIYSDCIEMAMENCYKFNNLRLKDKQINLSELKQSMHVMHRLGIIHFDIKPDNIMFSQTYNKCVFIDYNLSEMRKGQLGNKMPSNFKGTLNFCSPQMFDLFNERKLVKYIDLYYNDAYCLKTSIAQIQSLILNLFTQPEQQLKFCVWKNANDAPQNEQQLKQFDFLMVSRLKVLLFKRKWEQSSTLFQSIVRLGSKSYIQQIAYFFQEIEPTYHVKTFFHKHIQQSIKDSFQLNFINKILDFKNYFSLYQLKAKNYKQFFKRRVQEVVDRNLSVSYELQDWLKLEELLATNISTHTLDLLSYSKLYFQFISYSNNVHKTDSEKRIELSQHCLKLLQKDESFKDKLESIKEKFQGSSSVVLTIVCVNAICDQQLQAIRLKKKTKKLSKDEQRLTQQNIKIVKNLYYEIIEHFFILDVDPFPYVLESLNSIFHNPIFSFQQRLLIFLKVKQSRIWMNQRLTLKSGINRYDCCFELSGMLFDWYHILSKICPTLLKQLFLSLFSHNDEKLLFSLKTQQNLHFQLAILLKCEYIQKLFQQSQSNKIKNIINQVYLQLQVQNRGKIYPILFVMLQYFLRHNSVRKYTAIMDKIKNNVNDTSIMAQLSINHHYQCRMESQTVQIIHILCQWQILKGISLKDILLHLNDVQVVIGQYQYMATTIYQYVGQDKDLQLINQSIINKMMEFASYCVNQFNIKESKSQQKHQPLTYHQLTVCLNIICTLDQRQYNQSLLNFLRKCSQKIECKSCKREIQRALLHFQQRLIIIFKQIEKQQQFMNCYKQLMNLRKNNQENEEFTIHHLLTAKTNHFDIEFNLLKFCHLKKQLQKKYEGSLKYFQAVKENKAFDQYFERRGQVLLLVSRTMQLFLLYHKEYFFQFLFCMSEYLIFHSSQYIVQITKLTFSQLARQINSNISQIGRTLLFYGEEKNCHQKFLIFYSYLLNPGMNAEVSSRLRIKMCKNMNSIDKLMSYQFQKNLYYVYIFEDKHFNQPLKPRKKIFLMNQIIRLNHKIGNAFRLIPYKNIDRLNDKEKNIVKKIEKIDFHERYLNLPIRFASEYTKTIR